uniref:Uncharacterized protein n=1 Tax=uncultured bacterium contig00078 TaxID=1181556 RepID=A0A806KH35_9BACT|nr:hypothetical protein [uncultured bacterium contig00078]
MSTVSFISKGVNNINTPINSYLTKIRSIFVKYDALQRILFHA